MKGFSYRQGYRAGWRSEPMPATACPAYRQGYHDAREALMARELSLWGVRA